jgi:hypothetical protein
MKTVTLRYGLWVAALCVLAAPAWAQTNVTFQVDLNTAIERCIFDPAGEGVVVGVPGSFNDWNTGASVLTDDNDDGIYTGTFAIEPGEISYKFWGTGAIGWEDDPNRTATIGSEAVTIDVVEFNRAFPDVCGGPNYELYFAVDMSVRRLQGLFDPATHRVFVAGGFQGWDATNPDTELFPNPSDPDLYIGLFPVSIDVPSESYYKFTVGRPTLDGGLAVDWEGNVGSGPDGNRVLSVTGTEEDTDGNGLPEVYQLPAPFFNNVDASQIIAEPATVRFEVDLRPAYYFLRDNGALPSDTQTGEPVTSLEGLFINGPVAGLSQQDSADDWATWGPEALGTFTSRQLFDDGTNGDRIAGDSTYTRIYNYPAGTDRMLIGKFGINGYDNEGGFAQNHHFRITEGSQVIQVVFGCILRPDGTYSNTSGPTFGEGENAQDFSLAWQPYTLVDNSGETPSCVVRPGGVSAEPGSGPSDVLTLRANYPNPFAQATTLEYALPAASHVSLSVYDLMGRRVATLVDEMQAGDVYRVRFDAGDLASGTYLFRLVAGDQVLTQRMTVLR